MKDWEEKSPGILNFIGSISKTENAIWWLRSYGILREDIVCDSCELNMKFVGDKSCKDGYVLKCLQCKQGYSIRRNSLFFQSKLGLTDLCILIYFFCQDMKVGQVERLMPNISRLTIGKWFKKFRKVCDRYLKDNPILMEGDVYCNRVVEIDESIFGKRRKYNKGRKFRQSWVFGMVQKETRKVILHIVENRKKVTLIPLITDTVKSGSKIYHDDWASYRKLHEYGYSHGVVVHTREFKSKDGVCTNTIEGVWGDVKTRIRSMHGVRMIHLSLHLQEYSYRYMFKDSFGSIYNCFLEHLALYW